MKFFDVKTKNAKRICQKGKFPTHSEAREIIKQLKKHPEVCDNCPVKPCVLAKYLWGE